MKRRFFIYGISIIVLVFSGIGASLYRNNVTALLARYFVVPEPFLTTNIEPQETLIETPVPILTTTATITPEASKTTEPTEMQTIYLVVDTTQENGFLNLRERPTMNSQVLEYLPEGSKMILISQLDNGWIEVEYSGIHGYVYGKYVREEK